MASRGSVIPLFVEQSAGTMPIILDDFSNSSPVVLERLQQITGQPVACVAAWPTPRWCWS